MSTGVPISTYPMEPVGAFGCKGSECPRVQGRAHCCRCNLRKADFISQLQSTRLCQVVCFRYASSGLLLLTIHDARCRLRQRHANDELHHRAANGLQQLGVLSGLDGK